MLFIDAHTSREDIGWGLVECVCVGSWRTTSKEIFYGHLEVSWTGVFCLLVDIEKFHSFFQVLLGCHSFLIKIQCRQHFFMSTKYCIFIWKMTNYIMRGRRFTCIYLNASFFSSYSSLTYVLDWWKKVLRETLKLFDLI